MGSYCLMDMELQFGKMKKVLEVHGGDGCTTVRKNFIPLSCTLKNG